MPKKKLLFLLSDTGGGHRSSAEAIEEAFNHLYPDQFEITKVDFLKNYSPWPFNQLGPLYPKMLIGNGFFWQSGFKLLNNPKICKFIFDFFWPVIKTRFSKLFTDFPDHHFVSLHPLVNYYLTKNSKKFVLVITDLVTAHTFWYMGKPSHIFAPTQAIKDTGVKLGLDPNIFQTTGLPISLKFKPKTQSLNQLNHLITILLMGGGQGMGKLNLIAQSLNRSNLLIKLIIVAGQNQKLESQLRSINWQIPVEIFGFTKEIPYLMQRSDVLLTKAGPSTICEGLTTGLPIIIYNYLPGQETANVDYVIKNHAGYYCPDINSLTHTLSQLNSSQLYNSLTSSALKLSRPQASMDIAKGLYKLVS